MAKKKKEPMHGLGIYGTWIYRPQGEFPDDLNTLKEFPPAKPEMKQVMMRGHGPDVDYDAEVAWARTQGKKGDIIMVCDGKRIARIERIGDPSKPLDLKAKELNPPKYEVRAVKYHEGMEGQGYNCELYRDGIKVAHVLDEGRGGPPLFNWYEPKGMVHHTLEEALFDNFAMNQPPIPPSPGMESYGPTPCNDIYYMDRLMDKYDELKKLKKWCKGQTLFRLKGDKVGTWKVVGMVYSEEVAASIRKRHGDALEEIANERSELYDAPKTKKKTRRK